jgi:hypothetical protein
LRIAKSVSGPKSSGSSVPKQFPQRFVFHGNAVAAEVIINRVGQDRTRKVSPVQGQSSLPVIGGHSESLVAASDPAFSDVFSYGECRTQADGFVEKQVATTTVSASVRDVRLINRPAPGEAEDVSPIEFRSGFLSVTLRSTHARKGQPRIEFVESPQFEGLFLNNLPIELELRKPFMNLSRMADLDKRFRTNRKFYDDCRNAFLCPNPEKQPAFGRGIPILNGYAICSIVQRIRWGDQTIEGHVLTKKGFGSIYFGEMLLNENNRRLTLVRVKMGSDTDAEAALAESDPNGGWWPPEG